MGYNPQQELEDNSQISSPNQSISNETGVSQIPSANTNLLDYLRQKAGVSIPIPSSVAQDVATQGTQGTQGAASPPEPPSSLPTDLLTGNESVSESPEKSDLEQMKANLANKYGFSPETGTSQDDVDEAQKQRSEGMAQSLQARALGNITNGLAFGHAPGDENFYKALETQAQQHLKDVQERRDALQGGMKNDTALDSIAQQQVAEDPNSQVSKSTRALYAGLMQKLGSSPDAIKALDDLSASDIDKYGKNVSEKLAALSVSMQNKAMQMAWMTQRNQAGLDDKNIKHQETAQHSYDSQIKPIDDADKKVDLALSTADLAATNTQARNEIYGMIQPILTDSKRLSPEWVKHVSGGQDVATSMERSAQKLVSGTLDNTDIQNVKGLLGLVKQNNAVQRTKIEDNASHRLATNLGSTDDEGRQRLGLPPKAQQSSGSTFDANAAAAELARRQSSKSQ